MFQVLAPGDHLRDQKSLFQYFQPQPGFGRRLRYFRPAPDNGLIADIEPGPFSADTVAKVVLHWWSKLLRAADAVFV